MAASSIHHVRIHPGIGLARVGNSDDAYIGPEAPGQIANLGKPYKDSRQRMKRQAQRFRVFGYDAGGNAVTEINGETPDVESVEWRVHVRNLKAANYAFEGAYLFDPTKFRNQGIADGPIEERSNLIVDPGVQRIGTTSAGPVELDGRIFDGIEPGELPGFLKFRHDPRPEGFDPTVPVPVTYEGADVNLGRLELDERQRLLFVAGPGVSRSVTTPQVVITNPTEHYFNPRPPADDPRVNRFSYFNVPGWYDDTCGGSIDVTIRLRDGTVLSTLDDPGTPEERRNPLRGAWVVTAPPKYVPNMIHVVSLLDRVFQNYPDADPTTGLRTNFYRDIFPILERATNYAWVSGQARKTGGHAPGDLGDLLDESRIALYRQPDQDPASKAWAARNRIYNILRHSEGDGIPAPEVPPPCPAPPPRPENEGPSPNASLMPRLWGTGGKPSQNQALRHNLPNQWLSLTPHQLARFEDWAKGDFETGSPADAEPQPLDAYPIAEQPTAMDMAALEPTIGGGFHPGIEFPYLVLYEEFFAGAFRVAADVTPGSLAAYMSCPWQGDFWSCNTAWWPVQRPDVVVGTQARPGSTVFSWFRGYLDGVELDDGDGYDQMVEAWWQLGMVLPTGASDDGEPAFTERERNPALDDPTS